MGKEKEEGLGNNNIEDVSWLCSLSESELDLLISLKKLALKRASAFGHLQLAQKFDLKMLRALVELVLSVREKEPQYRKAPFAGGDLWLEPTFVENIGGFVLMECLRQKVEHLSLIPGMDESAAFLDSSNLLKCKLGEVMSIEEVNESIAFTTRKEFVKRLRGKDAIVRSNKRLKVKHEEEEEEETEG